jgi:hypothetical protein
MSKVTRQRALVVWIVAVLSLTVFGIGASDADDDPGHEHPPGPSTTVPNQPPTTPGDSTPGAVTKKIRYQATRIPGAPDDSPGGHAHGHTGNIFQFGVQRPCVDCYITGMSADLVYADGRQANWSTDAMLHHMVLFNSAPGRSDATCAGSFLGFLGERFFAAGDERTPVLAPPGYGYYSGWFDNWTMISDLSGNSALDQTVHIEVTYKYVPAFLGIAPGMSRFEPVWLDVDQCGDSAYPVQAGRSTQTYTWTVNRPGKILGLGGHLHDGGVNLEIVNDTTGQVLCNSVARYGETPAYRDHHGNPHLSSMSTCRGTGAAPLATLTAGQRVSIRAHYDAAAATPDVMGIAVAYLAPA